MARHFWETNCYGAALSKSVHNQMVITRARVSMQGKQVPFFCSGVGRESNTTATLSLKRSGDEQRVFLWLRLLIVVLIYRFRVPWGHFWMSFLLLWEQGQVRSQMFSLVLFSLVWLLVQNGSKRKVGMESIRTVMVYQPRFSLARLQVGRGRGWTIMLSWWCCFFFNKIM